MAIVYAISGGVWSDTGVWNGGSVPTTSDDVFANGYNITLDLDTTTVASLRNHASGVINANGSFHASGDRINAYLVGGATTSYHHLIRTPHQIDNFVVSGNMLAKSVNAHYNIIEYAMPSGNFTYIGDMEVDTSLQQAGNYNVIGIMVHNAKSGQCDITVSGNVHAMAEYYGKGIETFNTNCNFNITGDIRGGMYRRNINGGQAHGFRRYTSASGNITVLGNVRGGGPYYGYADGIDSRDCEGDINITGNVYGGSGNNTTYTQRGIYVDGPTTNPSHMTIVGDIQSVSTVYNNFAVYRNDIDGDFTLTGNCNVNGLYHYSPSRSGNVTINGNITAGNFSYGYGALVNLLAGRHTLNGTITGGGNNNAIDYAPGFYIDGIDGDNVVTVVGTLNAGKAISSNSSPAEFDYRNSPGLTLRRIQNASISGANIINVQNSASSRYSACLSLEHTPFNGGTIDIHAPIISGANIGNRNYGIHSYQSYRGTVNLYTNDIYGGGYTGSSSTLNNGVIFDHAGATQDTNLNVYGNIHGGDGQSCYALYITSLRVSTTGVSQIYISGDINASHSSDSYANNNYGLYVSNIHRNGANSDVKLTIDGNIYAGSGNVDNKNQHGLYMNRCWYLNTTINGNIYSGNGNYNRGLNYHVNNQSPTLCSGSKMVINGDLISRNSSNAYVLYDNGYYRYNQDFTLNGNIVSHSGSTGTAFYWGHRHDSYPNDVPNITIRGDIISSGNNSSIYSHGGRYFDFRGSLYHTGSYAGPLLGVYRFNSGNIIFENTGILQNNKGRVIELYGGLLGPVICSGNFRGSDTDSISNNGAVECDFNQPEVRFVTWLGNFYPGNMSNGYCIYRNHSIDNVVVSGTIHGSENGTTYTIFSNTANGSYGLPQNNGVSVQGTVYSNGSGWPSIYGAVDYISHSGTKLIQRNSDGSLNNFVLSTFNADFPPESTVKSGVYFDDTTKQGTLVIPDPINVAYGVPVDTGVGTAVITSSSLLSALGMATGNLDSQLQNINVTSMSSGAVEDIFSTYPIAESYAASGSAGTPAQIMYLTQQAFTDFDVTGTSIKVRKIDGSGIAATYSMDHASTPTSRTRST